MGWTDGHRDRQTFSENIVSDIFQVTFKAEAHTLPNLNADNSKLLLFHHKLLWPFVLDCIAYLLKLKH